MLCAIEIEHVLNFKHPFSSDLLVKDTVEYEDKEALRGSYKVWADFPSTPVLVVLTLKLIKLKRQPNY